MAPLQVAYSWRRFAGGDRERPPALQSGAYREMAKIFSTTLPKMYKESEHLEERPRGLK
jgi:hypothetical protein